MLLGFKTHRIAARLALGLAAASPLVLMGCAVGQEPHGDGAAETQNTFGFYVGIDSDLVRSSTHCLDLWTYDLDRFELRYEQTFGACPQEVRAWRWLEPRRLFQTAGGFDWRVYLHEPVLRAVTKYFVEGHSDISHLGGGGGNARAISLPRVFAEGIMFLDSPRFREPPPDILEAGAYSTTDEMFYSIRVADRSVVSYIEETYADQTCKLLHLYNVTHNLSLSTIVLNGHVQIPPGTESIEPLGRRFYEPMIETESGPEWDCFGVAGQFFVDVDNVSPLRAYMGFREMHAEALEEARRQGVLDE